MSTSAKVIFSLVITFLVIIGFLTFPYLDQIIETCTGSILCGRQLKDGLDYFSQTDSAAIALGGFFYSKLVTGIITFLVILAITVIAHRVFTRLLNKPQNPS